MTARSSLGSITERSPGTWRVRVSAGRDPRDGKRMTVSATVHGSRRDAEVRMTQMLADVGALPERAGRMTVREYVQGVWLPSCETRLKKSTVHGYRQTMEQILPVIGHIALVDLRPTHVDAVLKRMDKPGAKKKAYAALRAALRWALKRRMVSQVATDAVDPPHVEPYEPRVLDATQASRLLAAFRDTDIEAAILLALGCGLRRSEICGLDWEDVDTDALEVDVRRRYLVVAGQPDMDSPKTRNSRRVVSLPASFAARLRDIRPADMGAASPDTGGHPLLRGPDGARMPPDRLSNRYATVADQRGVHWCSLKNLRHSHATMMLDSGVDIVSVSRRLGHSNVSTTDAFYLRPRRAADQRAASAFDGLGLVADGH